MPTDDAPAIASTGGRSATSPKQRSVRKPQQARSRRTREKAVAAARHCFEEFGYDETTTAMIAERAGIAVGTLYGYFRDKREILLELLDEVVSLDFDRIITGLDPESWRDRDPRAWTRSLVDMAIRVQGAQPGIQRIMWERYFKDPEFQGPFDAQRARMKEAIVRFIDGIAAAGQLRDIDRDTAASVILNAVQWNTTQLLLHGASNAEIETSVDAVSDMVIRFLFVDADQFDADPRDADPRGDAG